jgi:hypothetical protein
MVKTYNEWGYEVSEIKPAEHHDLVLRLDSQYFDSADIWRSEDGQIFIPQWSNKPVVSKPFYLPAGKYRITVVSKGNAAGGIYPHSNLFLNDNKVGDFNSTYFPGRSNFIVEVPKEDTCKLKIAMDNDANVGNEDRNSFVLYIDVSKAE